MSTRLGIRTLYLVYIDAQDVRRAISGTSFTPSSPAGNLWLPSGTHAELAFQDENGTYRTARFPQGYAGSMAGTDLGVDGDLLVFKSPDDSTYRLKGDVDDAEAWTIAASDRLEGVEVTATDTVTKAHLRQYTRLWRWDDQNTLPPTGDPQPGDTLGWDLIFDGSPDQIRIVEIDEDVSDGDEYRYLLENVVENSFGTEVSAFSNELVHTYDEPIAPAPTESVNNLAYAGEGSIQPDFGTPGTIQISWDNPSGTQNFDVLITLLRDTNGDGVYDETVQTAQVSVAPSVPNTQFFESDTSSPDWFLGDDGRAEVSYITGGGNGPVETVDFTVGDAPPL